MYTFTISIRQIDNTRRVIAETQQPGVATGSRQEAAFSLDVDSLSSIINDAQGHLEYGQRLGEAVFTQKIEELFKQQLTLADGANQRLHVLLSVEDESLKGLAWERLCTRNSSQRWQFLRLQQQTPYSLYIPSLTEKRFPAITRVGLRALVVVVNHGPTRPYGLAEFDAAATVASLREALGGIPCTVLAYDGDQIVPGADGLPTLDEICRQMTDAQHQLLHIVCHGARDLVQQPEGASADLTSGTTSLIDLSESGTTTSLSLRESYLFLRTTKPAAVDDPTKGVDRVKAKIIIDRLAGLTGAKTLPHLTFLCSCQTASQESGASLEGLAQRLVRELGMPAVVAMTRSVSIPLAQSLAFEFYRSFRKHGQPDVALVEACAGLASHGDVLVPNLYSRLGGRPLFSQDADLTNEEWDLGINELEERLPKHAPVLVPEVAPWISQTRQALVTRRRSLQSGDASPDLRNSLTVLNNAQAEFDRITREVLGHPFENLARGESAETSITETVCPFPGLAVFDKEAGSDYRKFFFGRETETRELVAQIERQSFVVVLGGSGSGKSSLVRAGVLPELQSREPKPILLIMKPGMSPLAELERQQQATPDANLIFVDQFEEVFTQCTDIRQRKEFIDRLLELQGSGRVVLTMRVDFLGDCAAHDGLHRLLDTDDARHWKLLQPLAGERLRKVVEAQAKAANLQFEPGLLTEIFKDLGDEPGAMALLQHCMRQLWQYRHGPWLKRLRYNLDEREAAKYPDFKHVGGVKGAIARTADEVFETLQPAEQRQCEFLFDRLVLSDLQETDLEKRRLTRKRVDLTELTPAGGDQNFTRRLVDRLATARLLVVTREETDANPTADAGSVDSDSRSNITVAHALPRTTEAKTLVEVTHEALIRSWTRLHRWLADAEITRKLRERINTDCKRYNDNPQPENLTLWGSVLEEAEQLANAVPAKLNQDESHFVSLCRSEESKKLKRTAKIVRAIGTAFTLISILLGYLFLDAKSSEREAIKAKEEESVAKKIAEDNQKKAERSERAALKNLAVADIREYSETLKLSVNAFEANDILTAHRLLERVRWDLSHGVNLASITEGEQNQAFSDWPRRGAGWEYQHLLTRISAKLIDVFQHSGDLDSVALSPDGLILASGGPDSKIRLWNIKTREQTVLSGHTDRVTSIAFSSDGKRLYSGSWDTTVRIWDADNGIQLGNSLLGHSSYVTSIASSPDGLLFASGDSDSKVFIWDARTGKLLQVLKEHSRAITFVQFSPDGKLLATTGYDNTIRIWDVKDFKVKWVLTGHSAVVNCVAFNKQGTQAASCSDDKTIRLWDTITGQPHGKPLLVQGFVTSVAFSQDNMYLGSSSTDGTFQLWNNSTKEPVGPAFRADSEPLSQLVFNSDGTTFVTATKHGTMRIWNIFGNKTAIDSLVGHADYIEDLDFSPDGTQIASGSRDRRVLIWDSTTAGKPIKSFNNHTAPVLSVAYSPTGAVLASGSSDTTIRLWDTNTSEEIDVLLGHTESVLTVAFSPDGMFLASGGSDGTIRIWDTLKGVQIYQPLKDNPGYIHCVSFSPDGKFFASCGSDKLIRLWDTATWKQPKILNRHKSSVLSIAFSHDGKLLASGGADSKVFFWDANTGELLRAAEDIDKKEISNVAFTPDGTRLATAVENKIKLLDTFTAEQVGPALEGHSSLVTSVKFSPDGKRLASGSYDNKISIWNTKINTEAGKTLDAFIDDPLRSSLSFCQDGIRLAIHSGGLLQSFDTRTGHRVGELDLPDSDRGYSVFGYEGQFLAVFSPLTQCIHVYNSNTGESVAVSGQYSENKINSLACSNDGNQIVIGYDGTVRLWRISSGKVMTMKGQTGNARCTTFSPTGTSVASSGDDATVRVWDTRKINNTSNLFYGHEGIVNALAYNPNGDILASGGFDKTVRLWCLITGKEKFVLKGHTEEILCIAFAPSGEILASSSADRTICLWNSKTGKKIFDRCITVSEPVTKLAFSTDGLILAGISSDSAIRLWDLVDLIAR